MKLKPILTFLFASSIFLSCSSDDAAVVNPVAGVQLTPVIIASDIFQSIDENTPNGTNIAFVNAMVTNGNVSSYELTDLTVPGSITINQDTGGFFVAQSSLLDFETNPIISGNVVINVNSQVSETIAFSFGLNDVFDFDEDVQALTRFFFANDNNTLGWDLLANDISTWTGVTIENGRVTKLQVANKGIETIPSVTLLNLTELTVIDASNNTISGDVDLENNSKLTTISLFSNMIGSINLQNTTLVNQLLLESNILTQIDLTTLAVLTDFKAHSNTLTSADISNGNNSNMTRMELQGNAGLTCIKVDTGATSGFTGWNKPSTASYNTTCP